MDKDKIIQKQDELIKLLKEELDEAVQVAFIHGWRSSRIEQGKKLRAELSALKEEPEVTDDSILSATNDNPFGAEYIPPKEKD